jgi:uncharacterized heparinase superfamily protein
VIAVRPRPVLCVIEHEHRDRGLAEAVAQGRFTHVGEPRDLGIEPDWLTTDLPADEEWRFEWVKFYYGLDLADAYRATGDARFLEAWERLVASYILQVPPDHDSSEVTARRILNWIYAWQRLPEADLPLADSIREQAAHVRANLTPERNHRTLELYALLIAGLALNDDVGFAVEALHENLLADFLPDGVHREASTHYHMVALRSFAGAAENCRRYGIALPATYDARLAAACEFAHAIRRPDGTIPALSDSDTGDYGPLLALAARVVDAPIEPREDFPDGGYFVQRAGERFLIFDCGPLGDGGHGHYDALSVEAWAGATPLVLDPGRFTYAEPERRWFRGTAAHNTVTVDGLDQTPYARGRSNLPSAQATFLGRDENVLAGEVRSPMYDAVHRRTVQLRDADWVVDDELHGSRHRYDLRWHLPPGPARALADGTVLAKGVTLRIEGARSVSIEPGWISPRYGHREVAPVVSAVTHGDAARFRTVIAPWRPGDATPAGGGAA